MDNDDKYDRNTNLSRHLISECWSPHQRGLYEFRAWDGSVSFGGAIYATFWRFPLCKYETMVILGEIPVYGSLRVS